MRQLVQHLKTGKAEVISAPAPGVKPGFVLIQNRVTCVSSGTERTAIEFAQKNLLDKARARPDLVNQVLTKVRNDGLLDTVNAVNSRLDEPLALGYSAAGIVTEAGAGVSGIAPGSRVAAAGAGYAVHAETIQVPARLVIPIPDNVDFESASFVALGAIAMHGVRMASVQVGECVGVIGLGMVGQLALQILKAAGCRVVGMDLKRDRLELALRLGADAVATTSHEFTTSLLGLTNGRGADAVIIAADSKNSGPLETAAEAARERAIVVAVGATGLEVPRRPFYEKELDLRISRSYGPGRYDPEYEEKGLDYPHAYVRWTEARNMESFLNLIAEGKVLIQPLITHRFDVERAEDAYRLIGSTEPSLGVVIQYPGTAQPSSKISLSSAKPIAPSSAAVGIGMLGAGTFARSVLLPAMAKAGGMQMIGISTSNGATSKLVGSKFGFSFCSTRSADLLSNDACRVIAIVTRHNAHAGQVVQALKAGKHVFTEKPLCLKSEELIAISQAYLPVRGKQLLTVGYNRRFAPFSILVKSAFDAVQEPLAIHYRINAGSVPAEHWIHDPEQGGGRILGEICHFVDFAIYLSGSMPVSVQASTLPDSGKYVGDNVVATIRFANGSIASITYVANGDRSFPKERCEVFGGNCVAIIDDFRSVQLNREGRRTIRRSWLGKDKGHVGEWKAIVDAIRKGGLEPIRYEEIVGGMLATIAIKDSIQCGRSIEIDPRPFLSFAMSIQKRLNYYRRVARAYLTSNPSQLTFWHEVPEANVNARTDVLSEYPMLFRSKADYPGPFDDKGVPMLNYHGTIGVQYNPIAIAQFGLANYNLYRQTNSNQRADKFFTVADWLVRNLEQSRFGTWVWNHHFDWDYRTPLKAPWFSGLAQGQGISVLVRAFQETKESRYLDAASKALDTFFRETKDGGVIHFDKQGDLWVEEYLVEPPTHILNGFIWGIWGLYDYALLNSDPRIKKLFDTSANTIERNLHRYDIGYWSLYELSGTRLHMIASPFYHSLHIVQLRIMSRLTGRSKFEEFAARWDAYRANPVKRTAALAYKAAFKLCYY